MIEIRFAGFGGQGVLTTGMVCATAGMDLGKNVTWYPSYGSQMRGGTANCSVKFDDNDKTYTTKITTKFATDDDKAEVMSFDATVDYSALMGQQVKALYKEGKNGDDDTLYGIYATDKNKTVTALVDDIDKYDGGFKVNGKEYDFAKTVNYVAPNGTALAKVSK